MFQSKNIYLVIPIHLHIYNTILALKAQEVVFAREGENFL